MDIDELHSKSGILDEKVGQPCRFLRNLGLGIFSYCWIFFDTRVSQSLSNGVSQIEVSISCLLLAILVGI